MSKNIRILTIGLILASTIIPVVVITANRRNNQNADSHDSIGIVLDEDKIVTESPTPITEPTVIKTLESTPTTEPTIKPTNIPKPTVKPTIKRTVVPVERKIYETNEVISYAKSKVSPEREWQCLMKLWGGESSFEPGRINKSSNAVGIPQAYPPTKLYPNFYSMSKVTVKGKLYLANPDYKKEIDWGLNYINTRYGSPCSAYNFWLSKKPHWY